DFDSAGYRPPPRFCVNRATFLPCMGLFDLNRESEILTPIRVHLRSSAALTLLPAGHLPARANLRRRVEWIDRISSSTNAIAPLNQKTHHREHRVHREEISLHLSDSSTHQSSSVPSVSSTSSVLNSFPAEHGVDRSESESSASRHVLTRLRAALARLARAMRTSFMDSSLSIKPLSSFVDSNLRMVEPAAARGGVCGRGNPAMATGHLPAKASLAKAADPARVSP
ncbi:MAG: hypothetical protein ACREEE_02535, partial [Dongiaceae bacterium]